MLHFNCRIYGMPQDELNSTRYCFMVFHLQKLWITSGYVFCTSSKRSEPILEVWGDHKRVNIAIAIFVSARPRSEFFFDIMSLELHTASLWWWSAKNPVYTEGNICIGRQHREKTGTKGGLGQVNSSRTLQWKWRNSFPYFNHYQVNFDTCFFMSN